MEYSADFWISQLKMDEHPEGGYYQPAYRSPEILPPENLPERYQDPHHLYSSIYFLVTGHSFSALHRLRTDELWFFHQGNPLQLHLIHPDGKREDATLGLDILAGEKLQFLVPHNCWFGARVAQTDGHSLVSCSLGPGFEFADFELGNQDELLQEYPQHESLIMAMTRK